MPSRKPLLQFKTKDQTNRERLWLALSLFRHAVNNFRMVDGWKSKDDPIGIEAQQFLFLTKIPVVLPIQGGVR